MENHNDSTKEAGQTVEVYWQGKYMEDTPEALAGKGVSIQIIQEAVEKPGKMAVKQGHSDALLSLTAEPTRAETVTWPSKTRYAIQNKLACMVKTGKGEQPEDGEGLTAKQRSNVMMALLPGETINGYLGVVFDRVEQFEELAFFAEGFKRRTQQAFNDAAPENKQAVLKQAETEMAQALSAFATKLAGQG